MSLAVVLALLLSVSGVFVKVTPDKLFQLYMGTTPAEPMMAPVKWMPMLVLWGTPARPNVPPASTMGPEPRADLFVTLKDRPRWSCRSKKS